MKITINETSTPAPNDYVKVDDVSNVIKGYVYDIDCSELIADLLNITVHTKDEIKKEE